MVGGHVGESLLDKEALDALGRGEVGPEGGVEDCR